ncbi:MAG: hypothetical protein H0W75_02965 [Chitinophagaceae bacterium]|nr:hypothetical protein [Chitinophagaceae bacterium]
MQFRKVIYFGLILAGLLIASYCFQPIKKGKGIDDFAKYKLVKDWLQLPGNFKLGNPTGIGIDTNQNIIIFHRADREWSLIGYMPDSYINSKTILILDKQNGKIIDSWGDNLFIMPHGLTVDKENNIWVTDVGLHQVFKFNHNGKLLMKLGEAKVSGNDSTHFNKPTDVVVAEGGSFYVSDGYGNSRIIKFSASGKYLFEWGKKGSNEGEFNIPHGIDLDNKGNVYVADRENRRIQIFDSLGGFLKQWSNESFGSICSVAFDKGKSKLFAIDDFTFLKIKHRGSDVIIFDTSGNVQTRFGRSGFYNGSVCWYHDHAIDNEENIYIGDILGNSIQKFKKVSR